MAANMRARLHPFALRGGRRRSFSFFSKPTHRWKSSSSSQSSYTSTGAKPAALPKRHTAPVNWHALAAARAANSRSSDDEDSGRKSSRRGKNAGGTFSFSAFGLGGSSGGLNATLAGWNAIPNRVELPPLTNLTWLPWQHQSEGSKATAPLLVRSSSIFSALRKGPWMGCSRTDALVCTGVYRALKRTAAASIFDVDCSRHLAWLPKVIDKLLGEYRLVRVICAYTSEAAHARSRVAWGARRHVTYVNFTAADAAPSQFMPADVTLARESMKSNLILSMRFLKNLKHAGTSKFLVHENFPRERVNIPTKTGLRINAALPPFSLPPPVYTHQDPDDSVGVQINCRNVPEMFEMRTTPTMEELVDPRKRRILE